MINDLLNGESKGLGSSKIMMIPLEEIYTNPLNKAPITQVEELSELIQSEGLKSPLTVYKQENHHYVLINGERRHTAMNLIHIDVAPVIVIPKPQTELEERLLILDANSQREETEDYKRIRAKEYEELFFIIRSDGRIKTGVLKRDWIGKRMNLSGRHVDRLLANTEELETATPQHGHDVHVKEKTLNPAKEVRKLVKQLERLQQINLDAFCELQIKQNICEELLYVKESVQSLLNEIRGGKQE